ncbi:MAG: PAS domain S-box protein [Phycisphaerales bacterium]|nr:PAS domain S-box protein [Phycisphaerales bacterium]
MKMTEIDALTKKTLWKVLEISVVIFGLGMLLTFLLAGTLVRPLEALTSVAKDIASGNYDHDAQPGGGAEIESLSQSISAMSLSISRDITARKQAEKQLEAIAKFPSENPYPVLRIDADGTFLYTNPAATALLGSHDELSGEQNHNRWKDCTAMALKSNKTIHREFQYGDVTFTFHFTPIPDEGYVNAYGKDITERKRAEAALESRIVALTQPLDSVTPIAFEDLFDLEEIQALQDSFSKATDVASCIRCPDGSPITEPSNFCRLCKDIIRKSELGSVHCHESDLAAGTFNPDAPMIHPCLAGGLWKASASISVGGKHIANWLISQVRDEHLPNEAMLDYARKIGADEEEFLSAFREVPSMPHEQFEAIAQSLFTLAKQLSTTAYQNVQQARFITDRKQAEEHVREKEENLRVTLNSIGDAVIATDTQGEITQMNPIAEDLTGWPLGEARGKPLTDVFHIIHAQTREFAANPVVKVLSSGEIVGLANHTVLIARDGTEYQIADSGAPIRNTAGETIGVVLVFRDVTEDYALQDQLRQAQKTEAVGQLAGGIAHDFNNLLQAILGYGEMAIEETKADTPAREFVQQMVKAGTHAKTLTSQLLAFSRQQVLEMEDLNLNEVISDMMKMHDHLLGEHISIDIMGGHDLGIVRADRGQMGQILTNLCVNARDAMPDGGAITIETENIRIDEDYCKVHTEATPGRFVLLSVTDTGCGMNEKTIARAFDPFFSTKEVGRGTGLGLSTVYGLVKQHGGMSEIYSEIDKGTSFKIYLPIVERSAATIDNKIEGAIPSGTETILLAEDDEMVRAVCKRILKQAGYTVLTAYDGEEALRVFEEHEAEIDMAILDVVMPNLGGKQVYTQIHEKCPEMRFLFASGYSPSAIHTNFVLSEGLSLIQKPYQRAQLLRKVREILDQPQKG